VYSSQQPAYTQKLENNKRMDSDTPEVFTSEDTTAMDTTDIPREQDTPEYRRTSSY